MPRPRALARRSTELAALILTLVLLPLTAVAMPVEGYAPYQPQKNCNPTAKPGTLELARWLQRRYPGTGSLGISRACGHGGVSEHKEGRAFDWKVDASSKRDRAHVQDFLSRVLATDKHGNEAALARRMGIMYVLWNDHSWASYRGFSKADYRHSACRSKKKCSKTLRHRDHVHISLSRAGARGDTSWYHRHDPKPPSPAPAPTPTPAPTPVPDDPPADAVPARVLDFSERPYARFSVPADGTPVRARLALAAGATYKVTASGLVTYGRPSQVADAACVWAPDGWTARPPAKVRRSHGSLNLTVNGRAVFGTDCRSKHTYKTTLKPRRKTGLTLRVANAGPPPKVPGGRIVVVVSRVRTKVAEALPTRSPLAPAPAAAKEAPRGFGLLAETVTVRADRASVTTRQELQKGARYRVTVTGVASLGGGVRTDGRCVEIGGSWFGSAPLDRRRPDQDHGDLYLDGAPFQGRSQGAGCAAHHYVGSHVASRTGRLTLGLWDPLDRSDNSGAVTVNLQRLTKLATPAAGTAAKPRKKTTKAWRKGREWLQVPVDRAKGVQSSLRFRKGERVQLVVRGTVRSHGVRADAACVGTPDGWLREDPAVAVRQDPLELWVDGAPVRWRAIGPTSPCSDEHSYTVRHRVAKSGRLRLALLDLDHRDNTGSLRVTLLRQR